jgi:hypothetical protein
MDRSLQGDLRCFFHGQFGGSFGCSCIDGFDPSADFESRVLVDEVVVYALSYTSFSVKEVQRL